MNITIGEHFALKNVIGVDRHGTSVNTPADEIPAADVVLTASTTFNWLTAGGRTVYYEGRARLLRDDGKLESYV